MLVIKNLSKSYKVGQNNYQVLSDISFQVNKGELLGIMGKSGSGKSTLLRHIGLLETPDKGEIIIDQLKVNFHSENELTRMRLSEFGFVFQDYNLLPDLTAVENVIAPALLENYKYRILKKRAIDLLCYVGLENQLNFLPAQLSGGQQQRVAMARALINEPSIVIADEPTSNLDSKSSYAIRKLIQRFKEELNKTILVVSHDEDDMKLCDRLLYLKDGVVRG